MREFEKYSAAIQRWKGRTMVQLRQDERADRAGPVRENMSIQQVHWRIERVGFYVLLLLILATMLGLFSKGPLSHARDQTVSGSLALDYQRYLRNGAISGMVLMLRGPAGKDLDVQISGDLLESVTIEGMVPTPAASATHEGSGLALRLRPDAEGRARVHLALRADGLGLYRSTVSANGESLSLRQFIYP
ncbi:hypothetical protein D3C85_465300 [compost metagenome]